MGRPGRPDRTVTVERVIDAAPDDIFDLLADPQRHHELDGSGMLLGAARGPERLTLGAKFSMAMQQSRATYRSLNRVIEFDDGRLITWETVGERNGRRFIGGQRWRFELVPIAGPNDAAGPGPVRPGTAGSDASGSGAVGSEAATAAPTEPPSTLVLHSYDWGSAMYAPAIRLLGYPRRMARSMPTTLQRLAAAITRPPGDDR